jgi:hypothetical protein
MVVTWVRSQANICVVDRVKVGRGFLRGLEFSQNHSTSVLYSCLIHVPSVLHSLVFTFDSFIKENTSLSVCLCLSYTHVRARAHTHTHTHTVTTYSLAILCVKVLIAVDEVGSFQDNERMPAACIC